MEIKLRKFLNSAGYKDAKNVLVIGVVHGDEPQGEFLINEFLKNDKRTLKNNLYYIPRLNFSSTRKNKNGVDINRNFPTKNWEFGENDDYYGGYKPNSEEETKMVTGLMNLIKFDAVITIHSPYKIVNYDGPAETLAAEISKITGYPVQKDIGYPTPGSFGTYSGVERNIPTITIEVDEETPVEELYPRFEKLFYFLENMF